MPSVTLLKIHRNQDPRSTYHEIQENNGQLNRNVAPIPSRDASPGVLILYEGRWPSLNASDRSEFQADGGCLPTKQHDDPGHLVTVYQYLSDQGPPPIERANIGRERLEFSDTHS